MANPKPIENILIIDFETSGLDSKTNQALQLGAIVVRKDTLEILDKIKIDILFNPSKYKWTYGAQKIHKIPMNPVRTIEEQIYSIDSAGRMMGNFIYEYFGGQSVTLCGHNPAFDKAFLEQILNEASIQVQFKHRMIDTSSIGMALWNTETSDDLFKLVGIERTQKHDALEDAMACYKVLVMARKIGEMN